VPTWRDVNFLVRERRSLRNRRPLPGRALACGRLREIAQIRQDRTDPSALTAPSQLGKGEAKDISSLIASIQKALGEGRGPMFGGSGMFRVMGQLMELSPEEVQLALSRSVAPSTIPVRR